MYLLQIFLPMYDNAGEKFPVASYVQVREELVQRFGGMTAYTRAPVQGLWQPENGKTVHDELVIYEVLAPKIERVWWRGYKRRLEQVFRQEEIMVRAQAVELL